MEIRLLRYFLTVAHERNITRAADVLHITQPTLSRQLKQLEDDVGTPLFIPNTRPLLLTQEGILLRRRAVEVIELIEKAKEELQQHDEDLQGTISIGCGALRSVDLLATWIKDFRRLHPKVRFDIFTAASDVVREYLDQGRLDFGLVIEPFDIDTYHYLQFPIAERWVALLPIDSPLTDDEGIRAETLAKQTLIIPRHDKVQGALESWFGKYAKHLHIDLNSNLSENACYLVDKGLGIALILEGSLPFIDHTKIALRPLMPPLTTHALLIHKKDVPLSTLVSAFQQHCHQSLLDGYAS